MKTDLSVPRLGVESQSSDSRCPGVADDLGFAPEQRPVVTMGNIRGAPDGQKVAVLCDADPYRPGQVGALSNPATIAFVTPVKKHTGLIAVDGDHVDAA